MKKLFAIYLVFWRGYSVVRFDRKDAVVDYDYGACNRPMGYDYSHSGMWGRGNKPAEAVYDSWNKNRKTIKFMKKNKVDFREGRMP